MNHHCLALCENPGYEIVSVRSTDELFYENTLMLSYDITLPKIRTMGAMIQYIPVNQWYDNLAAELRNHARLELYPMAVEDYEYRKKEGFPFNEYTLFVVYEATFTSARLFSAYEDVMEYTGGAHPNTIRGSQTWDLCRGEMLKLSDLFLPSAGYRELIMSQVRKQADELAGQGILFEDYVTLLNQYFDPKNFYLSREGLVIFYPLYTIAPYASGIITFLIPYEKICTILNPALFCKERPRTNPRVTVPPPFVLGRL